MNVFPQSEHESVVRVVFENLQATLQNACLDLFDVIFRRKKVFLQAKHSVCSAALLCVPSMIHSLSIEISSYGLYCLWIMFSLPYELFGGPDGDRTRCLHHAMVTCTHLHLRPKSSRQICKRVLIYRCLFQLGYHILRRARDMGGSRTHTLAVFDVLAYAFGICFMVEVTRIELVAGCLQSILATLDMYPHWWTARESNPNFFRAKEAYYRCTSSPTLFG